MNELELPDDFDLAQSFWESLQKGPELKDQEVTDPTEGVKEDAIIDPGPESQVENGESDQGGQGDQSGGPRADASRGDGDTSEPEPGRDGESGDTAEADSGESGQGAATTVTTVHPSGPDTAPSEPDPDEQPKPKRRGPKFKRHRHFREHSTA